MPRFLVILLGVVVAYRVVRNTTWYLAIDQFGYLTFARDLAVGKILHAWELLPTLGAFLPKGMDADVLAQTYVFRSGGLFCRYSPGFPMILAAVGSLFGENATHYVNPVFLGLLLICCFWVSGKALESAWLGLAAALIVTLVPNYMLLWSISPLRDVPAHLMALAGLGLLIPSRGERAGGALRWAAAGLLLGFAVTIRVDAVLYGVPALGLAWLSRPWRRGEIAATALAIVVGAAPLLAYNTIATGNPFRPTQAMELDGVLSRAPSETGRDVMTELARWIGSTPAAWAADEPSPREKRASQLLQGGGIRLRHLAATLPANLNEFRTTFGDLGIALGILGAIAAVRSPTLFLLAVPYCVASILFFSLWPRPDPRYLAGAMLLFPLLVLEGARDLVAAPALFGARFGRGAAWASAGVLVAGVVWAAGLPDLENASALPWVIQSLSVSVAIGLIASMFLEVRVLRNLLAVLLGVLLAGVGTWRSVTGFWSHASFQRPQVELARDTLEAALEPNAVVITSSDIGRPAENINHYTRASAVYLQELLRWGVSPGYFVDRLIKDGFSVYLLLPPEDARQWMQSPFVRPWFAADLVAEIPPWLARHYFVASPYHDGVELWLVKMTARPVPLGESEESR